MNESVDDYSKYKRCGELISIIANIHIQPALISLKVTNFPLYFPLSRQTPAGGGSGVMVVIDAQLHPQLKLLRRLFSACNSVTTQVALMAVMC